MKVLRARLLRDQEREQASDAGGPAERRSQVGTGDRSPSGSAPTIFPKLG